MAKILKFRPPEGTLKRLLQRSIVMDGGKLTGTEPTAPRQKPVDNDNVLPLFRPKRRRIQF